MLRVLPVLVGSGRTLSLACSLGGLVLVRWRGPIPVVVGIASILLR
jgi:uncharacterized membrane protein